MCSPDTSEWEIEVLTPHLFPLKVRRDRMIVVDIFILESQLILRETSSKIFSAFKSENRRESDEIRLQN